MARDLMGRDFRRSFLQADHRPWSKADREMQAEKKKKAYGTYQICLLPKQPAAVYYKYERIARLPDWADRSAACPSVPEA